MHNNLSWYIFLTQFIVTENAISLISAGTRYKNSKIFGKAYKSTSLLVSLTVI